MLALIGAHGVAADDHDADNPTAEDYIAEINANAIIVPNGELEIVGRVRDADGRPLEGVLVTEERVFTSTRSAAASRGWAWM